MDIPTPPRAVVALAAFVRQRLADVSTQLATVRTGPGVEVLPAPGRDGDPLVVTAARQFAVAVVGAAAPFAPTSYARARLLRQMAASGLLTPDELRRATTIIDVGVADGRTPDTDATDPFGAGLFDGEVIDVDAAPEPPADDTPGPRPRPRGTATG